MISFFVAEIFEFAYYAKLATDDVIGCTSTVVRNKVKNISANNEAMLLRLGRGVAPYKMYQMVHILMLLWQHARFQLPFVAARGRICSLKCYRGDPMKMGLAYIIDKTRYFSLLSRNK